MQGIINANVQVSGSAIWNIPVWITLVRQDNGTSSLNSSFSPLQYIEDANQFFNNGMVFYVCGVTYLDNSNWYNLSRTPPSQGAPSELVELLDSLHNQNNPAYSKGYIDILMVGGFEDVSASAYTELVTSGSHGAIVVNNNQNSTTLAHELGHFFSLLHTHTCGPVPLYPNTPQCAQYVDSLVVLNGLTYGCHETGDFICDTPADPGKEYCVHAGCSPPPCTVTDPFNKAYSPDKTLLISYYNDCRYRFSDEQNSQMVAMYTANPNWYFIYDSIVPDCQSLSSDVGFLRRNCKGVAVDITPIEGVEVRLIDSASQSCGPIVPITNDSGRFITHICAYLSYNGSGLLTILPDKDYMNDLLNGVSTYDLLLIKKHILGLEPIVNPFQIIAADANNSGSVTSFDIVTIRNLILGKPNATLPAGSWRYVPEYCFNDQAFSDEFSDDDDPNTPGIQLNPFNAVWTNPDEANAQQRTYGGGSGLPNTVSWMDHISINPLSLTARTAQPWSAWGIKTGDVNCNAILEGSPPPFGPDKLFLMETHSSLNANQEFTLQIRTLGEASVSAWQFGVDFAEDSLQILEILAGNTGEYFSTDNFGLWQAAQGEFRALNFDTTGTTAIDLDNKILFKLKMKALQPVSNIGDHFRLKNSILEQKFYAETGAEIEDMDLRLEVTVDDREIVGESNDANKATFENEYRLSVHPIPFYSELVFDFFLPGEQQVSLSLFDSFGRLISTTNTALPKGTHSVRLYDLARQPAGLYLYRFESGQSNIYGKTVKN